MIKIKYMPNIYLFILFLLILPLSNRIVFGQDKKTNDFFNIHRELPVYGYIEYVFLGTYSLKVKAKLDSGAKTSSLKALDIVEFERDGEDWVKFNLIDPEIGEKVALEKEIRRHIKIKQHGSGSERRPVVMMEVRLGQLHIKREFSLTSKGEFIYQVLLSRNFLNGIALIDVSKTFLAKTYTTIAKRDER